MVCHATLGTLTEIIIHFVFLVSTITTAVWVWRQHGKAYFIVGSLLLLFACLPSWHFAWRQLRERRYLGSLLAVFGLQVLQVWTSAAHACSTDPGTQAHEGSELPAESFWAHRRSSVGVRHRKQLATTCTTIYFPSRLQTNHISSRLRMVWRGLPWTAGGQPSSDLCGKGSSLCWPSKTVLEGRYRTILFRGCWVSYLLQSSSSHSVPIHFQLQFHDGRGCDG